MCPRAQRALREHGTAAAQGTALKILIKKPPGIKSHHFSIAFNSPQLPVPYKVSEYSCAPGQSVHFENTVLPLQEVLQWSFL
jgi:hypothetical protein